MGKEALCESMKKQELVHLHGLGKEVNDCLAEGRITDSQEKFSDTPTSKSLESVDDYLERYDEMAVYSTSIHKSKTGHGAAVMELFSAIAGKIEDLETQDDDLDPVKQRLALAQDREEHIGLMEEVYGTQQVYDGWIGSVRMENSGECSQRYSA